MDEKRKMHLGQPIQVPGGLFTSFRYDVAKQDGVQNNVMIKTMGGVGDIITSEPAIRYAVKNFTHSKVSLTTRFPHLFHHIPLCETFDFDKHQPLWEKYLTYCTMYPGEHYSWQFINHMLMNCVDYASICAFMVQLPTKDREIHLVPSNDDYKEGLKGVDVVIHPGKNWQSKTFPKEWWDSVVSRLNGRGITPVVIGTTSGTVDIDTQAVVDLRDKQSLMETVALLQTSKVLISNDSSVIHMAASRNPNKPETGHAWIGMIATTKHPDNITHWRHNRWAYRTENLSLGGIWTIMNFCPNQEYKDGYEVPPDALLSWLPAPEKVAYWAQTKASLYSDFRLS